MKKITVLSLVVFMLIQIATVNAGSLEDDWVFQAGGSVDVQDFIQQLSYTRQLAERLRKQNLKLDLSKELAQ